MLMTLMNYDLTVAQREALRAAKTVENAPEVTTTVAVVSERRDYLLSDSRRWSWSQLRDYVVAEIESRHGPIPNRDTMKESSIFKRFLAAHGEMAGPIAEYAFEVCNGRWRNAPISTYRFCANSDDYFASIIKRRISERT